jgi:sodium/pantothenate symporter
MNVTVISALLAAFIVYIAVGLFFGRRTKGVADLLPLSVSSQACVKSVSEFSASTVATSISLATVVMAFFDLADTFGIWLFWTVITTAIGLWVVKLFAKRIWEKIVKYDHRPTLNEFLGREFNSDATSFVSAVCTSLGFLGVFAVELTVGSKFFAGLLPNIPSWFVIIFLSAVAFAYTTIGGFRAVIVTDRIQMYSIWLLIFALPVFYIYYVISHGGWAENFGHIPEGVFSFSSRNGLVAFILGVFVINVPTYISDLSIWQRIGGAQENKTVNRGLLRSVIEAAITWGCLAALAIFSFMLIKPVENINPLITLVNAIGNTKGPLALIVLFLVTSGLYGAMLSTASTQLIAVSHTMYEDIFSRIRRHSLKERIGSKKELHVSRLILILAAIISTALIQLLSNKWHFTIANFVFAIYGAQLGLCPLVIAALLLKKERLQKLSKWAVSAISAGFLVGWGSAIYGKIIHNEDIIYLSPVSSLIISSLLLFTGILIHPMDEGGNLTLLKAVLKARKNGLLRLFPAAEPLRLCCLKDKCAKCCRNLGSPVVTVKEAEKIDSRFLVKNKNGIFTKSKNSCCCLLQKGLCSVYPDRPRGCREYPFYNIDGILYYDAGCPGIKKDKDGRPDAKQVQPFENFLPRCPKIMMWLIKKMCVKK